MTQEKSAQKFYDALEVINKSDWNKLEPKVKDKLNKALDRAVVNYRKAHNLSEAMGFFDCMNHYNQKYAK